MKPMTTRIALLLALLLGLLPVAPSAQVSAEIQYTWSAPTTGSPAVRYVVQHSVNGGPFVTVGEAQSTSYTLSATFGDSHRIRVAGVDGQDRQGPFSTASEPYTPDLGAPGQPGQPIPVF